MKTLFAAIALVTLLAMNARAAEPARPNIVLIFADDLGYSDLGCYGSDISTPNIDRLAAGGVRFTQFYNQARCCPSRAALLTGRYPHQVGVGAMIDNYARWIRNAANRPSYSDHLSPDSSTVAELLRAADYQTIMCGKWHLGDRPAEWPVKRGFDRSFVLIPGAMNYWGGETTGPRTPMARNAEPWTPPHDGFFATDAFTDNAIEFVSEAAKSKDRPFFLYLAYNAPHWPLHAPPQDIEKYQGAYDAGWQAIRQQRFKRMVDLGIVAAETKMAPMDRGSAPPWDKLTDEQRKEWALRMSIYAAQVTRMDQNIGRLLEQLDQLGATDNTLVFFVSDNGGAPEDPHRGEPSNLGNRDSFWGYARPWATVSNTPWKNHKVTAYEGGISTPAIAHWPAGISQSARGQIIREPAHLIDLLPTFLHLAAANPTTDATPFEGQNILPMLQGQPGNPDRTFYWEHEGNRAIRKGKWKLVALASKEWELYDVQSDRPESHNLATQHPQIVEALSNTYDAWAQRSGVVPWSQIEPNRPPPPTTKK